MSLPDTYNNYLENVLFPGYNRFPDSITCQFLSFHRLSTGIIKNVWHYHQAQIHFKGLAELHPKNSNEV